jgi:hypothetical protein
MSARACVPHRRQVAIGPLVDGDGTVATSAETGPVDLIMIDGLSKPQHGLIVTGPGDIVRKARRPHGRVLATAPR